LIAPQPQADFRPIAALSLDCLSDGAPVFGQCRQGIRRLVCPCLMQPRVDGSYGASPWAVWSCAGLDPCSASRPSFGIPVRNFYRVSPRRQEGTSVLLLGVRAGWVAALHVYRPCRRTLAPRQIPSVCRSFLPSAFGGSSPSGISALLSRASVAGFNRLHARDAGKRISVARDLGGDRVLRVQRPPGRCLGLTVYLPDGGDRDSYTVPQRVFRGGSRAP